MNSPPLDKELGLSDDGRTTGIPVGREGYRCFGRHITIYASDPFLLISIFNQAAHLTMIHECLSRMCSSLYPHPKIMGRQHTGSRKLSYYTSSVSRALINQPVGVPTNWLVVLFIRVLESDRIVLHVAICTIHPVLDVVTEEVHFLRREWAVPDAVPQHVLQSLNWGKCSIKYWFLYKSRVGA